MSVALSRPQIVLSVFAILANLSIKRMPRENRETTSAARDFRISKHTMATLAETERAELGPDVIELPRIAGPPVLFAIARDPRTIFTYWYIDWASIFENTAPLDRQVHLRVYRNDGAEEASMPVEPMAGQHYLTVSQPRSVYRVEIGYDAPKSVWNSVATSDEVVMPADAVADNVNVDLATIPFHLSFQRLIDLFRSSNTDALAEIVSRLQTRAISDKESDLLTAEEWEILRAMDLSLEDLKSARGAFDTRVTEAALRRRAEVLLGFGASSPSRAFDRSSWS
jgi:hypothetical protein